MDIRRIGLVSATVLSVFAAYASDKSFFAADGGWEVDANWSPSGVPAAGDVVKIPVGTVCRLGPGVATANVQTTVDAGGTLLLAGGTLATSDNSAVKKNLTVNGRLTLASGVLAVHDLTIGASGKAELAGGSVSVYNNMYNNAATTATTGLHIGQEVVLAKGYWNFNAHGGVIEGVRRALTEIRVPTGTKTTGTLSIRNSELVVDTLGVAYHLSNRNNLTGRVEVVAADVAVKSLKVSDSHITGANVREIAVGTGATLSFLNSQGWKQGADESLLVKVGGEGVADARLVVTNTSGEVKSVTLDANSRLSVAAGGSATVSKVYVKAGGELAVDGGRLPASVDCLSGGQVRIDGGTVEGVVTCAGGGRVTMDGGTLRTAQLLSGKVDTEDEARYRFDGGAELYLQDVVVGGSTVSNHAAVETTITPTTMEFLDCRLNCLDTYCYLLVGSQSNKNAARVVFDGCKMKPADGNYKWYVRTSTNTTCDIVVRGSRNELYFQQLEGSIFRLEYVFDGSARQISTVNLERQNHPEAVGPAGHLHLTLPGGALLTAGASFDLIRTATAMNLAQKDFASTPWSRGASPWTGALADGGKAYRVTLNAAAEAAPGSGMHELDAAKGAGAVAIPVDATDKLETLSVTLIVADMTPEKAASLVAALTAAGYTATADATSVTVVFPASAVTPDATNWFVWDFTGTAEVSSVRVAAKHAPEKFYLHFL